jgi:hypothetical protein
MAGETLPSIVRFTSAAFEAREISDNAKLQAMCWRWHARRPGFEQDAATGLDPCVGPEWRNYLFYFDVVPTVCFSIHERRQYGYELHIAAAPGKSHGELKARSKQVRIVCEWVCDLLTATANPETRLAAFCARRNRAAMRLLPEFLTYESDFLHNNEVWCRFGTDVPTWVKRNEQRRKNGQDAV